MNRKTAEHYNELFALAQPTILLDDDRKLIGPRTSPMMSIIRDLLDKWKPAAIAAEIRDAAAEARLADLTCISISQPNFYGSRHGAGKHQWELAMPEILAALAADNALHLTNYERYRALCAQGAALPPEAPPCS